MNTATEREAVRCLGERFLKRHGRDGITLDPDRFQYTERWDRWDLFTTSGQYVISIQHGRRFASLKSLRNRRAA